jgi:hypothetical protein
MGKKSRSGSGIRIPRDGNNFWVKILQFLDDDVDLDPGSGSLFYPGSRIEKILSRIRDKYPGSVTLLSLIRP